LKRIAPIASVIRRLENFNMLGAVAEQTVHDCRFHRAVEYISGRAYFDAQHDSQPSRVSLGPVAHGIKAVQTRIATHADHIEAGATARQIQFVRNECAETGREQAGRGYAAKVTQVREVHACAVEATLQGALPHFNAFPPVFLEKFALAFMRGAAVRVAFGKGQEALFNSATQEYRANPIVIYLEPLQ
jgi:hypothetical protein